MSEGRIIEDRYRLIKKVGEGASASVWEAEHIKLSSRVAVKLLHRRAPPESDMALRFMREARVAASVKHANVIEILDFGIAEGDEPYMVMEFLRGFSLAKYQDELGTIPIVEALRLVALTLKGLAVVHEAGIIHRDVKPDNIFLVRDDDGLMPKILDFGLSRHQGKTNVTHEGTLLGTPDYMSPEQARGRGDIDARADLYSTGVILYHLLTKRLPFEAQSIGELLVAVASSDPTPIESHRTDLPQELVRIVRKATARRADDRYPDARAMRADILRLMETGQVGHLDPGLWAFTPAVPSGLPTMREESVPAAVRNALEHELSSPPKPVSKERKQERKQRNPYGEEGDETDGVSTSKTGAPAEARRHRRRLTRIYAALVAILVLVFVSAAVAFFQRSADPVLVSTPLIEDGRGSHVIGAGEEATTANTNTVSSTDLVNGSATTPTEIESESIAAGMLPAEPDMQFIDTSALATEIPPVIGNPEPAVLEGDPPHHPVVRTNRRVSQSTSRHTSSNDRRRTNTRPSSRPSTRPRPRRR